MTTKHRIVALSDSPFFYTGYANQSKNIMKRLSLREDMDVTYVGVGYSGQTIANSEVEYPMIGSPKPAFSESLPFRVISSPYPPREHIETYGQYGLRNALFRFPDTELVVALADTFMLRWMIKDNSINPARLIVYFPSDGYPLPAHCEQVLAKANVAVAMAKDGQAQAKKQGIKSEYIPHAIDESIFRPLPLELKMKLREMWSARLGLNIKDKFIVGWFGKNQPRKMLAEWVKAFAEFVKGKEDNVIGLMHCVPQPPGGLPLPSLLKQYGIEHLVKFTGLQIDQGFSPMDLNGLYNICNVSLSLSSGEGFGIMTAEAMAAGVPMIITDYTNTKELVPDGTGLKIPVQREITGTYNVQRAFADIMGAVKHLNYCYYNPKEVEKMAINARKHIESNYTWSKVYPQWESLIRRTLNDK